MTSFISALNTFMGSEPHGKKIRPEEFKQLTYQDKLDLHKDMTAINIICDAPMQPVNPQSTITA